MKHIKLFENHHYPLIEEVADNLVDIFDEFNFLHEDDITWVNHSGNLAYTYDTKYPNSGNEWRYRGDRIVMVLSKKSMEITYNPRGGGYIKSWRKLHTELGKIKPIIEKRLDLENLNLKVSMDYSVYGIGLVEIYLEKS